MKGDCEIASDNATRQLYATDASHYQVQPACVAFPRSLTEAVNAIKRARDRGLSVTPRGAGTGLVGGALGDGMVVDFARHNRRIWNLDRERQSVRVGAGVVLDQLNDTLKPLGLCFGPDVATSSRATLGGMIANDSSGARVPAYGTTMDHVMSVDIILADGRVVTAGGVLDELPEQRRFIRDLVWPHAGEIQARMPAGLMKRWPGYGIARYLCEPDNLVLILSGSEGTLAGIWSAEVSVMPLPRRKALGIVFFASMAEALQAGVELSDLEPVAIEHIDRILLDQTRGQRAFQAARDLLELDAKPCESLLIVEFHDPPPGYLADLEKRNLGQRTLLLHGEREMNLVWALRKAGLALLTGCKGEAKPVTGIEDTAVRPRDLPAYVKELQGLLQHQGLHACFYGHAASGLLHVRPVLDLHSAGDLKRFRQIATEVLALVRQFGGSFSAEHGVGIARTEFMTQQVGEPLLEVMRQIKRAFDPNNIFNPGKVIPDGRYQIDYPLRLGPGYDLRLPFEPLLAFAAKDASFVANLEQCNGCGACRKDAPSMCPTYIATGDEAMSTRGRANLIRAVLEGRGLDGGDPLRSAELELALSNCLSCKACDTECPSNVSLTLLKAELLHARHRRDGLSVRARLFSSPDLLGRIGCLLPAVANELIEAPWFRQTAAKLFGIAEVRPLPRYADERFDHWFARRARRGAASRGPVLLWDDTFVRYHEPQIGRAAVEVLEAAGFEVRLPQGRHCCGRPAFSQGNLDEAKALGMHNLALLESGSEPILFLEPSCFSMFAQDYRELGLAGANEVSRRCRLFEHFVSDLLTREPLALKFKTVTNRVAIHAHCHTKSLMNPGFMAQLVERVPGTTGRLLDTGCCGMAGAFGMTESKYELSKQIAQPLINAANSLPSESTLVASGTSCRQQITQLSRAKPIHIAELLARALDMAQA